MYKDSFSIRLDKALDSPPGIIRASILSKSFLYLIRSNIRDIFMILKDYLYITNFCPGLILLASFILFHFLILETLVLFLTAIPLRVSPLLIV